MNQSYNHHSNNSSSVTTCVIDENLESNVVALLVHKMKAAPIPPHIRKTHQHMGDGEVRVNSTSPLNPDGFSFGASGRPCSPSGNRMINCTTHRAEAIGSNTANEPTATTASSNSKSNISKRGNNNNHEKDNGNTETITTPHKNDVLSGRGAAVNQHPGNVHYREIIRREKLSYVNALIAADKKSIISKIVMEVHAQNPPGRFLKRNIKTHHWEIIPFSDAKRKTGQALREDASHFKITKGSNGSLVASDPPGPLVKKLRRHQQDEYSPQMTLSKSEQEHPSGDEQDKINNTSNNLQTNNIQSGLSNRPMVYQPQGRPSPPSSQNQSQQAMNGLLLLHYHQLKMDPMNQNTMDGMQMQMQMRKRSRSFNDEQVSVPVDVSTVREDVARAGTGRFEGGRREYDTAHYC